MAEVKQQGNRDDDIIFVRPQRYPIRHHPQRQHQQHQQKDEQVYCGAAAGEDDIKDYNDTTMNFNTSKSFDNDCKLGYIPRNTKEGVEDEKKYFIDNGEMVRVPPRPLNLKHHDDNALQPSTNSVGGGIRNTHDDYFSSAGGMDRYLGVADDGGNSNSIHQGRTRPDIMSLYEMMKQMQERSLLLLDDVPEDDNNEESSSVGDDEVISENNVHKNILSGSNIVSTPHLPAVRSNRNLLVGTNSSTITDQLPPLLFERDDFLKQLWQRLLHFVYFIQGPLTGLCIATLYDISLSYSRQQKLDKQSSSAISSLLLSEFMSDIGVQRLYMILNIICLSGMIIQVPLVEIMAPAAICHVFFNINSSNTITSRNIINDKARNKEGSSSHKMNPRHLLLLHSTRIFILVLYFISTLFTLFIARIVIIINIDDDVDDDNENEDGIISNIINNDDDVHNHMAKKAIFETRLLFALCTCRAICCLVAWTIEIYSSFSSIPSPPLPSSLMQQQQQEAIQ
mmetsp:Transcript_11790/g.22077  ORF Transcript_11790/g.22077 Transcript_11790/m.22077 type:complete len:509 (+) Transcript_11790:583-2109(+)